MATSVPSESETQGEPSLSSKIETQREKLQDIIAPGFGLTVKLYSCEVLKPPEKRLIDSKETTDEKNKLLLDFILNSQKCEKFVQALRECGQAHVANWIAGNGVYTPQFGLDWPLGEKELHFLRTNLGTLIEMLDTEGDLLGWLLSMKVINAKQMEHIKKKPTSFDCNEAFLEILNQSSLKAYHLTTICLRESNQVSVSELFENGGVVVPVHSTQGGNNVEDVEQYIANEMVKWCMENKPLLRDIDANRLLELLIPKLNAVKIGKSIILFVSCCKIGEFQHLCAMVDNDELKKILEKLFNKLLPLNLQTTVLLVTIYNADRENAENYFERELLRDKKYDEHFERLRSQLKFEPMEVTAEPMEITTEPVEVTTEPMEYKQKGESVEESEDKELPQKSEDPSTSASVEVLRSVAESPKERKKFSGTGTQAVADEDTIPAIIRNNFEFFNEHIRPKNLIPKLASLKILTDNDRRYISSLKSADDKNHEILKVIRGSSVKNYYEFIKCLRETEQGPVANVAEKGGVTVKMKIVHEPIENIEEIEKEIVAKLTQLHETKSPKSEDLCRLLSQLKIGGMEILSARHDKGVITWIWCRSNSAIVKLEKLTKDNRLGNLFDVLFRCLSIPTVPKINNVVWENPKVDVVSRKLCQWSVKTSATIAGLKISGIAMMGDKIIACFQNRSALLMFSCGDDGNPVPQKEEPLKDIDTPMHMAASLNLQCLYITDRTNNNIFKVSIDPEGKAAEPILWLPESSAEQISSLWLPGSSVEQINSLSVGRDDNLLILIEGKPNRLEIYNKDAKNVGVLKFPDQVRYPHNVAEASNGDFVVSYRSGLTPGGIYRITPRSGDCVSRLDLGFKSLPIQGLSKDERTALLSLSEGIPYLKHLDHFTLDDDDQVYACDADQYVVFLDSELNMEGTVELKDLKNPYRIHYLRDKKELLLVHGADQDSFSLLCSK